ncbi:BACK domain-containing protein [Heracleum sosnowskyi]|uniref:BACK domain-containing protein n=1 Tax=Heracleum sosnowskyi TaxID=360622 RepID=A0AAD8MLW3_9APIA|nr:BACK domain-containing protein [Heracleum sosnowskyi]
MPFDRLSDVFIGDETPWKHDASRSKDLSTILLGRKKTLHINSAILAAKSPVFDKLFSNGMRESEQRVATLRIHASEEVALMELLNFMYKSTLSPTTPSCLLDILMAADKYDVSTCMEYCSKRLRRIPITLNFALRCLDLPSSVLHISVLQQLTASTKQFIAGRHDGDETIVNTDHRFVERAYMYRPVQVVELVLPHHHCVVYLDLKREECICLYPAGNISSEPFHLGRQGFFLSAYCNNDRRNQYESQCFGLYLGMLEKGSASFAVYYEFSYWSKEEGNYKAQRGKRSHTFTGGKSMGFSNLFGTTWAAFIADDSPYFINGILHLRTIVSIK